MSKWFLLVLGSSVGGVARYLLSGAAYNVMGTSFPHGTLAVNLMGCLIIGLLDGLAQERFILDPGQRMLLMIGFCGAFTTFSTVILETSNMLKNGETLRAAANLGLSMAGGLAFLKMGEAASRAL